MKTVVVYPVPMETPEVWELFKPFVKRFVDTYRQHDAGVDHELWVIVNCAAEDSIWEVVDMFAGLDANFMRYPGGGADIGSFQFFAKKATPCFMVCCVSRVYFHCPNWLRRLTDIRREKGLGLYGTSASFEGGTFHVCTRCYAMDSDIFAGYPTEIVSRDQGTYFEVGRGNVYGGLGDWFRLALHLPVWIKGFLGEYEWTPKRFLELYGHENHFNDFRNGDQSNMLAWDKHTDAYAIASDEGKEYLRDLMLGVTHQPENV